MGKLVSGNPQDSLRRFIGELLSDSKLEDANRAVTRILTVIIIQTNQLAYTTDAIIQEALQWNKLCTDVTLTVNYRCNFPSSLILQDDHIQCVLPKCSQSYTGEDPNTSRESLHLLKVTRSLNGLPEGQLNSRIHLTTAGPI